MSWRATYIQAGGRIRPWGCLLDSPALEGCNFLDFFNLPFGPTRATSRVMFIFICAFQQTKAQNRALVFYWNQLAFYVLMDVLIRPLWKDLLSKDSKINKLGCFSSTTSSLSINPLRFHLQTKKKFRQLAKRRNNT